MQYNSDRIKVPMKHVIPEVISIISLFAIFNQEIPWKLFNVEKLPCQTNHSTLLKFLNPVFYLRNENKLWENHVTLHDGVTPLESWVIAVVSKIADKPKFWYREVEHYL